ncbi:MAG: PAS domain S-box protein [Chloroflexaceae bacterium]|nr:PAS domain S-box protein [Chloroflexaceae bacterium]
MVEHSLQGLVIYQDERLVFANETMARINGYSVAEMLQWTFDNLNQLIYPDDRAFVWGILKQRISDQFAPASYEYRITRKDGQVRWVEASGTRITYRGKAAAQGAYIDITERKIAEEALHASHKLLQKVLSSLDEAVFVVNPQTREIFECNHTAKLSLGIPVKKCCIKKPISSMSMKRCANSLRKRYYNRINYLVFWRWNIR